MISNKYVAVDLGSSKISALAAEVQPDGSLKILAVESKVSEEIKYGIVDQVSGAAFKINELVRLLQNSARIPEIDQISISIGAKSMKNHPVSVSRFVGASKVVTQSLIDEMHDECEKKIKGDDIVVLDVIPLSFELDGRKTDEPVGENATQITGRYTVIYGNKKITDELDRCIDRTGLKLEFKPLASEALSAAVLDEHERETGCALINFGATTTSLTIYNKGALQQMLVVPLGGKNITKDIQELGISEGNAERLKCIKGFAMEKLVENPIYVQIPSIVLENPAEKISTKFLATIIEARLEELMQPIFKALSNFPHTLESGIILTGGASKLANLLDFITEKTGLQTRFANHNDWLTENTDVKYTDFEYAQLIGTVILNHEYRQEHPLEDEKTKNKKKEPKLPKKGIKERWADGFMTFFGDNNTFETDTKKEEEKDEIKETTKDIKK